ncbi:hypothetical protein G6O69_17090 [Pseudenhygromyxa sp. WMMC2535]|uniref:TIGR02466 family protein n=1 Tax=Pseudenhygromyxa sp. WMMC2535 TaxID=2712867 RepID=UPI001555C7CD|nr:TIGR02466 family protein [Pseudenhygromyxa sp. WMMC2535]NVB39561.1 hypothetical protein [Pseudenhygromyxa sp. WMMC2535]
MDRLALFTTPIVVHQLEGMDPINHELTKRLLTESETSPGFVRSNVGGWHSTPDLSQREEPCYRALMHAIVHHTQLTFGEVAKASGLDTRELQFRFAVHAWAMVMRQGDYTILHDHAESHWSVAYYVDAGDADLDAHPTSGLLSFVDPRRTGSAIPGAELFPPTFDVRPQTGMLVVFPGWLQHYVHPYRGERPRVCVSANLNMELMAHPGH